MRTRTHGRVVRAVGPGVVAIGLLGGASGCLMGEEDGAGSTAVDVLEGTNWRGQERFLYIAAINSGDADNPDFLSVVGADPRNKNKYGQILHRLDMPNVGDNLHHYGYSLDQDRLLVPGLFSNRMHVVDVENAKKPQLAHTNESLVEDSGYLAPHTVTPIPGGVNLVSMMGADTTTSGPGGLILVDDETGEFVRHFGPGPQRDATDLGPLYMYDIAYSAANNRIVTTTWGWPDDVFQSPYQPNGDQVAVWDLEKEKVIQTASLGLNSAALEADWLHDGSPFGYVGTAYNGLWMWEDEDGDGYLQFHLMEPVLSLDITISKNDKYLFVADWDNDVVLQYDITNRYNPVQVGSVSIPHPCMMRLSPDGKRLYVTNSVLRTLDDDPVFSATGANNDNYGLWLVEVDQEQGGLTSVTPPNTPWVDFSSVQKKNTVGPAGPHMIVFDPGVNIGPGHH